MQIGRYTIEKINKEKYKISYKGMNCTFITIICGGDFETVLDSLFKRLF